MLVAERRRRNALDVPALAEGDDDLLMRLDVVAVDVDGGVADLRQPFAVDLLLERARLLLDLQVHLVGVSQKVFQLADGLLDLAVLVLDLLAFEGGQAPQLHVEDGLGLLLVKGEPVHQARPGRLDVRGVADQRDDRVQVLQRDSQSFEDVRARPCLLQLELRPAANDLAAEFDVVQQGRPEGQELRLAVHERHHVGRERLLHLRELVEVVENHHSLRAAAKLHDDAHTLPVRLIPNLRDAVQPLVLHVRRDLLDQPGFVDLVRQFGHDDLHPVRALHRLDLGHRARDDLSAPRRVGVPDALAPHDRRARREVGAGNELHQLFVGRQRMVDEVDDAVADLQGIVRRDVRRHSHGDARRPVDQQIRQPRRKHDRLLERPIEVVHEIDRLLVEVREHLLRSRAQASLRVPHRRGRVVVHAAEVALPVDERHPQREPLRETHHRVVDRPLTMRVVLAEHVSDKPRALAVR